MTDLQIDAEELEEKTEKNQSKIRNLQQTEATIRWCYITSSDVFVFVFIFVFVGTSDDFFMYGICDDFGMALESWDDIVGDVNGGI